MLKPKYADVDEEELKRLFSAYAVKSLVVKDAPWRIHKFINKKRCLVDVFPEISIQSLDILSDEENISIVAELHIELFNADENKIPW